MPTYSRAPNKKPIFQNQGLTLLSWGELLWDLFPTGPQLGGAAANVSVHATRLGAKAYLASCVGDDDLGRQAMTALQQQRVETRFVRKTSRAPTGMVKIEFEQGEPRFHIAEEAAWDELSVDTELVACLPSIQAIVFGSLAQRQNLATEALGELLELARKQLRVCDLNLRPPFYSRPLVERCLKGATLLKLNGHELSRVGELFEQKEPETWLLTQFDLEGVAITLGSDGARLRTRRGLYQSPGLPLLGAEGDPVGAGDAFTAALTLGWLMKLPEQECLDIANDYARQVASARGAWGFIEARD